MRRLFPAMVLSLLALCRMEAQTGTTGYDYLRLPVSAHAAATGGNSVSLIEDDAALLFCNPALLSNVSDRTLSLTAMSYMGDSWLLSAAFVKMAGERGTWAVGACLLGYGEMTETTADFSETGSFSASDIAVQGGYTYLLSERWSGGVQGKVLLSNYGDYSATALAVDLGLNYYDADRGVSLSLVAQNLGGEVSPLFDAARKLPFNLALGLSYELANAPIRLTLTLDDLTHWNKGYYSVNGEELSSGDRLANHVSVGVDIFLSDIVYVAAGYNFRRAYEMKVQDASHWAGFSLGAGLTLKRFKLGVAYGKYHVSASSLAGNVSYAF